MNINGSHNRYYIQSELYRRNRDDRQEQLTAIDNPPLLSISSSSSTPTRSFLRRPCGRQTLPRERWNVHVIAIQDRENDSSQQRMTDDPVCNSPQDTIETEEESLSTVESSEAAQTPNTSRIMEDGNFDGDDAFALNRDEHSQFHRFDFYDVEKQYDSDQSGKYKGHHHEQQRNNKIFGRRLTYSQICICWILLLGFSLMVGNNVHFEIPIERGGKSRFSWRTPLYGKRAGMMEVRQPHQVKKRTMQRFFKKDPFWFLKEGKGRSDLEQMRETDLEVIRRTSLGKNRGFSVRLRPSEKRNGMVRKDLLLASMDSLALCSKVERIDVDGDVDGLWLNHPSGKVRQLLDHGYEGSYDQHVDPFTGTYIQDPGSNAVLLLDADVAMSCEDLERGAFLQLVLTLLFMPRRSKVHSWFPCS